MKPLRHRAATVNGEAKLATHKHKCQSCGFVWEHEDACDDHHNAVPGSHECLHCGSCNWALGIYDGPEEPGSTPPGLSMNINIVGISPDGESIEAESDDGSTHVVIRRGLVQWPPLTTCLTRGRRYRLILAEPPSGAVGPTPEGTCATCRGAGKLFGPAGLVQCHMCNGKGVR